MRKKDVIGLEGKFSYSYCMNHDYNAAERKNISYYYQDFIQNINFILDHFQEPLFPRTISTKKTNGSQILVNDVNQIYKAFKESGFIDCRITAFPDIDNPKPNFIFIDLDENDTTNNVSLNKKLESTLSNFKKRLEGVPTVLWSGNGYHIYQPLECPKRLDEITDFKDFENPDNKFLRFEKDYLSDGYADKVNRPSLKSCLLRVPGSLNSKCLDRGLSDEESKVKIVQWWDNKRPPIKYQIGSLHSHLKSERMKYEEKRRELEIQNYRNNLKSNVIPWIEKLLKTPINDHRYFCLWRILIPYLVNIKRISEPEIYTILEKWLNECNRERKIAFDYRYIIK